MALSEEEAAHSISAASLFYFRPDCWRDAGSQAKNYCTGRGINVRFGSLADIATYPHEVRFTPRKRTLLVAVVRLLCANSAKASEPF